MVEAPPLLQVPYMARCGMGEPHDGNESSRLQTADLFRTVVVLKNRMP